MERSKKNNISILCAIIIACLNGYDDSKKFTRINRISEIFNKATSASLDWTTGNIYWIEHDKEAYRYSIKFTNKLFEEPQYIIQPAKMSMVKIQVYPKRNEIFFSDKTNIWYTSTLPNSTANLLFSSSTDDTWENLFGVFDFVIDYAHDRLWWNDVTTLYSVDISGSTRPLNAQQIKSQEFNSTTSDLLVFNNTSYWLAAEDYEDE
ncbi:hypothetical protein HCN44_001493 [Aphidius gifuensis]|uniref:Uncharacterized protein n=1 Tax=Aphidius gifuensis TaxID=684658 RepID=A0A834XTG9_APHGI|nr:hypothetical protein HCN44_001493 [Aphidius gifuensis]